MASPAQVPSIRKRFSNGESVVVCAVVVKQFTPIMKAIRPDLNLCFIISFFKRYTGVEKSSEKSKKNLCAG